ncbi:hypothetical protein Lalb_Chr13g0303501 [Lupinus albus]|uniref:Uncharacterized protein n=1 Tax=Lupinus albus TaxID=3870 RepID=A0A6A4PKD5_LUPAL|nr:hypothetical protein Lalb_Chr13g0303501 [Lupinus albus]
MICLTPIPLNTNVRSVVRCRNTLSVLSFYVCLVFHFHFLLSFFFNNKLHSISNTNRGV